jgi:hypothetical protein
MLRNLEKHQKYRDAYKPNDFYWGLGIEHETYFETNKLKQISLKDLKDHRTAERYCVNYYSIYTQEVLNKALEGLFGENEQILLPILVNSHTFQKTDINGQHQTTFERIPKPNPNFSGKTIFEWMKEQNPDIFAQEYEKAYIFDGDTIEFMTQKFYKTTVDNVIDELTLIEKEFMRALNSLPREGVLKTYGPLKIAQKNYPFASYLTNLQNNAMFNNGTIHINITLPTKLNEKAEIYDMELFTKQHQNFARAIQWISPLLIAKYGAYDPLSESKNNGELFSAGSQRVAVSRYIGLGTYDTDTMPIGKILTMPKDKLKDIDWYYSFHKKVDYKFLNDLGMDINFHKHFCHGLEFRILESLPINIIKDIMVMIVHLADFSLTKELENPKKSELWHKIAENCVHNGKGYLVDVSDQNELYKFFDFDYLSKEPLPANEVLDLITQHLINNYKDGICVQTMINGENIVKPLINTQLSSIPEVPTPQSEKSESESVASQDITQGSDKGFEIKEEETKQTPEVRSASPTLKKKSPWCCY